MIEVKTTDNTRDIFLITKYGQCIRFKDVDVRSTGRSSMGVIGMNLEPNDEVVAMQLSIQGDSLLIVSELGMGKRTSMEEFTVQHRGGKGVKCYKINDKTGNVVGVKAVDENHEIMLITNEGIIIQLQASGVSQYKRITSGVKLIDLKENVKVASVAKVRETPKDESGEIKSMEEVTEEVTEVVSTED